MLSTTSNRQVTRKGKRIKANKSAKAVENTKSAMCIRGPKSSQVANEALRSMYMMKKPNAQHFTRRHDYRPFEDASSLEQLCERHDASLFVLSTHNKRRPHTLTLGRLFDHAVLDMAELGVKKFKGIEEFACTSPGMGFRPCMVFTGDDFEENEDLKIVKNMFLDFFRGRVVHQVDLRGLDHVISVSAIDGLIYLRQYIVQPKRSGTKVPRVELAECGPAIDFELRRTHFASHDHRKEAEFTKDKTFKGKKIKNITVDEVEGVKGRVHTGRQDFQKIRTTTKLPKALRSRPGEKPASKRTPPAE